jgi:hypothetical protein
MGTSSSNGGSRDGLLPSWLDTPTPPPGGGSPGAPPGAPPGSPPDGTPTPPPAQPAPPAQGAARSFQSARTSFSTFAGGGGQGRLARGLGSYVGAVGGAGGATRRMGSSRRAAANLIGLARDFQSSGAATALAKFNLQGLAGRPAHEVFGRLIDELCPAGGNVDEAVAREGMLDAIEELAQANLLFEDLTPEQLEIFVADFITGTIEARVLNDIGTRAIELPTDIAAVENIQQQLHDAISGCVREAISGEIAGGGTLSNTDIQQLVDALYAASFALVEALAEEA